MSKSAREILEIYFDTRTRHRYLNKGLISQKDYADYLGKLPNDEDNFELAMFEDDDLDLNSTQLESVPNYSDDSADS